MRRANPLAYAIVVAGCIIAPLIVLGGGLRDAELARQRMVQERTALSRFIMGCVKHQQIHTCRLLHRMSQEQMETADIHLSKVALVDP
jgi:hypothetical protein